MKRLLYSEPFDGLEALALKLSEAALFARVHNHTEPAIEAREASHWDENPKRLEVYEETLSDQSTQLVAVVRA